MRDTQKPSTVQVNLSALRCYCKLAGNTNYLPENKELFLEKREPKKYNRAWLPHEIDKAIQEAERTKRPDIKNAILLSKQFGLRVSEVCNLKVSTLRLALGYNH